LSIRYEELAKKRGMTEGPVTKQPQPYNDPNWAKNLPKEKLDALAGKKTKSNIQEKSDDRKQDLSSTYFAESRLIKRTAIQEILSQSR
jgi:hypothetical protein